MKINNGRMVKMPMIVVLVWNYLNVLIYQNYKYLLYVN
jgi:hypothetical protein